MGLVILPDAVRSAVLALEVDVKRSKTGCNAVTWSSPGLGLMDWWPRVEGAGLFSHKVPHCNKAINVDSVSQWLKSDAVTECFCLYVCVWGVCVAEIIQKDNGPCVSWTFWQRERNYCEGDIHTISHWPTKTVMLVLYVQRLGTCSSKHISSISMNLFSGKHGHWIEVEL